MSVSDIVELVNPGDVIVVAQVLGEPTPLIDELLSHAHELPGAQLFVGMSLTDVMTRVPAGLRLVSSVGMAPNSKLIEAGRMQLLPCHMSALPWLLTDGPLKTDVALVMVSPPDADGYCSLGVTSDYAWHAVQAARVVLAEINEQVPVVAGDTRIHLSRFGWSMRTNRPLPEYPRVTPTTLEMRIAENVARYVSDGSCLQVGIGKLGEAVLQSLRGRRNLGVHAGMVGDTVLEMMQEGIITNSAKDCDRGIAVAGSVLGSSRAVALAAQEPRLRLLSIAQTHDPARIEALSNFVCVNSALEVDLLGQVNSETVNGRYVGALGGAVDFLRGSVRSTGGHSIVALPSMTPKGLPRIVPRVDHVSALGSDVDIIATEHGVAEVRGLTSAERVERIIAIAAPEHRESLHQAATNASL